ncbi:MAG TPA: hypothetical protein VK856_09815 [Anaerolineaceae bacterium]|nr:hypothetical protein [Anaerolineaceae bacterium]
MSVVIVSSVLIGTVNTFVTPQKDVFVQIPINVSSKELANYGDGVEQFVFPGVDIAIVDEILGDATITDQFTLENRRSEVASILQQPIPIATGSSENVAGNSHEGQNIEIGIFPTNTLSFTPTQIASLTMIPVTGTSTSTQGPSQTASQTLAPSLTSTLNPTLTWSPTITSSFSPTLIPSFTPTWTITATATFTPTWTASYTITPSLTSSLTPTLTWTPTLTNTPSRTATLTWTPSLTSTLTATSTLTPTYTVTFSRTPSLSPTNSITPSPTVTVIICNEDPTRELLVSMWPDDGSSAVAVDIKPIITFNQAMDRATLTYGDTNHIVICEKVSDSSNSCRSGSEVQAYLEIRSIHYLNDWIIIHPTEGLEKGVLYTMFAGNQIKSAPECSEFSKPLGGRVQSTFITISD